MTFSDDRKVETGLNELLLEDRSSDDSLKELLDDESIDSDPADNLKSKLSALKRVTQRNTTNELRSKSV